MLLLLLRNMEEEQYQPEAEQEEPVAQNFLLNLNFPMADDDEYTVIYRKPKAITPDLPIEEPDNSLNMGDEYLNTISETEKSSVENIVPIPSEFKVEIFRSHLLRLIFFPRSSPVNSIIDPILPRIDGNNCDEDKT
ncbi:hypothetical protein Tco_0269017 [Tanacetum coccineum]